MVAPNPPPAPPSLREGRNESLLQRTREEDLYCIGEPEDSCFPSAGEKGRMDLESGDRTGSRDRDMSSMVPFHGTLSESLRILSGGLSDQLKQSCKHISFFVFFKSVL